MTLAARGAAVCIAWGLSAGVVSGDQTSGPIPYTPVEPHELYVPEVMDETTRLWVKYSRRAALHGDLPSAVEQLQIAANTLMQKRNDDFELWDNLAELHCAQANRERDEKRASASRAAGVAMIAEFRCATQVFAGSAHNMSCKTRRGFVPNSAFTPLCYQLFCSPGARDRVDESLLTDDDDSDPVIDPYRMYLTKFREDAANLSAIEQVCKKR